MEQTSNSSRLNSGPSEGANPWKALSLFLLGIAVPLLVSALKSPPMNPDSDRRTAVVEVAEAASPAVVAIEVLKQESVGFFRRSARGDGSGVIINRRGYLITNFHVVNGARTIHVHLKDGKKYTAYPVAESRENDIAVLRIDDPREFPYLELGSSSDLLAGETVVAVGNPYGLEHTVSVGVVSAVRRTVQLPNGEEYSDFIQTDAAINPGNSGGALVNIHGQVVGLNTAIFNQGWGIAFAIPVDRIKELLAHYVENEHRIGLRVRDGGDGLRVTEVAPLSEASRIGIEQGDELLSANGRDLVSPFDLTVATLGVTKETPLQLRFRRDGREMVLKISSGWTDPELRDILWRRLGLKVRPHRHRLSRREILNSVEVMEVRESSEAERVDLRAGDLLFRVSARGSSETNPVASRRDLVRALHQNEGVALKVEILRGGRVYEGVLRPVEGTP